MFPSIQIKDGYLMKHCYIIINSLFYCYKSKNNTKLYQQLLLLAIGRLHVVNFFHMHIKILGLFFIVSASAFRKNRVGQIRAPGN